MTDPFAHPFETVTPPYYDLKTLICMIEEPNRSICLGFLHEHRDRFLLAAGSTHNHQAWTGGYQDHITEAMNLAALMYYAYSSTGRLAQLDPSEQFSLSDALLVLFLHDIEKLWGYEIVDGKLVIDDRGRIKRSALLPDKAAKKALAAHMIGGLNVVLTPALENALRYVEGMRDADYSPGNRVMLPLAAFCHMCDMHSARLFHGFPLAEGDAWRGAARAVR